MNSSPFALTLDAIFLLVALCGVGLVLQLIGWRVRLRALVKQRDDAELTAEVASVAASLSETKDLPRGRRRSRTEPEA